jgi:FAD/FMN-containing dehydrogenase
MSCIVDLLTAALGCEVVITGADIPDRFCNDWSGEAAVQPLALIRPRSTAEVSVALRLCHQTATPIVPQGGRSGLCGGARPLAAGVALSLDRMNQVRHVDRGQATLTAEAGCVLEVAQAAAAESGLLLGIDLGARGSCTVGGVISTNAGGNQVLRYGMTRDNVLGLEVVLADGTVLPALNTLLKNNVGLDLKQMFIGAEGCLGVVTQAVFRLHPRPSHSVTAFAGCTDTAAMLALLAHARASLGPALTSFEVMWPSFYDVMQAGIDAPHPLRGRHGVYVILEADGFDCRLTGNMEDCLATALEAGLVEDATLARNSREERGLWAVRESVSQYGRILGPLTPFDIGLPLDRMAEAVARMDTALRTRWPGLKALFYGHMGDSNLHLVVHVPGLEVQPSKQIKPLIYDLTREMGGTVSAEHGIGTLKRDVIGHSRSAAELAAMRAVKAALDPLGLMNPGRSFGP